MTHTHSRILITAPMSVLLTLLFLPFIALASEQTAPKKVHAIAMRGQPRQPKNFTHFSVNNAQAPKGGHAHFAEIKHTFDSLNPFLMAGTCAQGLGRHHFLTFDTLMEKAPDEPFTLYGRLAEFVELAPDRSWIVFHLNPKARFHDGSPVLAKDVKVTFETLGEKGAPAQQLFHKKFKAIEVLGPRSIKITFHKLPNGTYDREAPFTVAMRPVLSAQELRNHPFDKDPMKPLMGSGPYRIERVEPGRAITYRKVKNYWGNDLPALRGMYNFDHITYDYFASDVIAFEAFKAGLVHHWIETSPQRWKSGYNFSEGRNTKVQKQSVHFTDAALVTFLAFNTQKGPLKNLEVRKALGTLFDFNWINKNLLNGLAKRNDSHFALMPFAAKDPPTKEDQQLLKSFKGVPQEAFETMPQLLATKGDGNVHALIRAAHKLLKKADWVYQKGAIRNQKTGAPLTFTLVLTGTNFQKLALAYARTLKKAGITLKIKVVDSAHYQRVLSERTYDMIITSYGSGLSPGVEQQIYYGSYFAHVPSRNHAGVDSKVIDAVIDRLVMAHTEKEQYAACRALDRLLRSSFYMLPLFFKGSSEVAFWPPLQHPPLKGHFVPSIYAWWWDQAFST